MPTCHDFNQLTASPKGVYLIVGFSAGQVQLIDPIGREISKIFNEEVKEASILVGVNHSSDCKLRGVRESKRERLERFTVVHRPSSPFHCCLGIFIVILQYETSLFLLLLIGGEFVPSKIYEFIIQETTVVMMLMMMMEYALAHVMSAVLTVQRLSLRFTYMLKIPSM